VGIFTALNEQIAQLKGGGGCGFWSAPAAEIYRS
jgi:hypothetical protein